MTGWSGRPAPCRGRSGIVGRAGTPGTHRGGCAAQGWSGLAGVRWSVDTERHRTANRKGNRMRNVTIQVHGASA